LKDLFYSPIPVAGAPTGKTAVDGLAVGVAEALGDAVGLAVATGDAVGVTVCAKTTPVSKNELANDAAANNAFFSIYSLLSL
jgi:hypothetical protein